MIEILQYLFHIGGWAILHITPTEGYLSIPHETPTFIKTLQEIIYPIMERKIHIFQILLSSMTKQVDQTKGNEITVLKDHNHEIIE